MNIFLTGASGTGKTTLGALLAEHYGLRLQPSLSRTSPFQIGTNDHQKYISEKLFSLAMTTENTVFDRTPLDVVGYDLAYDFPSLAVDSMLKAAIWKRTCPILLYFPVYWTPEDDGFRPTDEHTTEIVDVTITTQLHKVEYLTMLNESPEQRFNAAVEYIDSKREA